MVTLRAYPNSVDAGIAKSILDEHNIFCTLADENANVYGGAPFAMPVRLLVNEEQADEGSCILATMAQPDSDQIEQLKKAEQESFPKNESADILQELKKFAVGLKPTPFSSFCCLPVSFSTFSSSCPRRRRHAHGNARSNRGTQPGLPWIIFNTTRRLKLRSGLRKRRQTIITATPTRVTSHWRGTS